MTMKPEELTKMYASLSAEQQEEFSKIATDFVAAAGDPDVVPVLFNVSKNLLNSPSASVRIPTSALTESAQHARRSAGAEWAKNHRNQMTQEEREEVRRKDAARKRLARAKVKTEPSDPSP